MRGIKTYFVKKIIQYWIIPPFFLLKGKKSHDYSFLDAHAHGYINLTMEIKLKLPQTPDKVHYPLEILVVKKLEKPPK